MKMYIKSCAVILLFSSIYIAGVSQQIGIDTDEIESLVDEWNFANNNRNLHSFEKVYGDRVLFYAQDVSKSKAIALKQKLFREKPWFRQRIVTEISFKPYSTGVVKCDFTKEVFEKTHWKKYPAYILVSYHNRHYEIVGESDYATDRASKHKPDLGEPIVFEKPVEIPDTSDLDSLPESFSDPSLVDIEPDRSADEEQATTPVEDLPPMFSDLSSLGVITIPKGYIVILIGMLGLGGLMIFIADSVQSRKRRPVRSPDKHDEAEHVVRDFKLQAGFEAFVITLFDPLYFRHRRPKMEHVFAGKGGEPERGPDFVFDFIQKDVHARFAIKCQYYKHLAKNEVQLFNAELLYQFRQFGEDRELDVYYVLGFGGRPDDPNELFFLPAKAVKSEYINKAFLRQYSKSGMFYYNKNTGGIQ